MAEDYEFIKFLQFWVFSALTKLLPCVMLSYFSFGLIR